MLCVVDRFVVQRVRDGDNVSLKRSSGSTPGLGSRGPSYARAHRTSDYNIPSSGTFTPIPWTTETFDTDDYWEGVTNPTRFTAPVDGVYRVAASVSFSVSADCIVLIGYWVDGATVLNSDESFGRDNDVDTNTTLGFSGSDLVELTAGQYVEITCYCTGATRTVRGSISSASLQLIN